MWRPRRRNRIRLPHPTLPPPSISTTHPGSVDTFAFKNPGDTVAADLIGVEIGRCHRACRHTVSSVTFVDYTGSTSNGSLHRHQSRHHHFQQRQLTSGDHPTGYTVSTDAVTGLVSIAFTNRRRQHLPARRDPEPTAFTPASICGVTRPTGTAATNPPMTASPHSAPIPARQPDRRRRHRQPLSRQPDNAERLCRRDRHAGDRQAQLGIRHRRDLRQHHPRQRRATLTIDGLAGSESMFIGADGAGAVTTIAASTDPGEYYDRRRGRRGRHSNRHPQCRLLPSSFGNAPGNFVTTFAFRKPRRHRRLRPHQRHDRRFHRARRLFTCLRHLHRQHRQQPQRLAENRHQSRHYHFRAASAYQSRHLPQPATPSPPTQPPDLERRHLHQFAAERVPDAARSGSLGLYTGVYLWSNTANWVGAPSPPTAATPRSTPIPRSATRPASTTSPTSFSTSLTMPTGYLAVVGTLEIGTLSARRFRHRRDLRQHHRRQQPRATLTIRRTGRLQRHHHRRRRRRRRHHHRRLDRSRRTPMSRTDGRRRRIDR